MNKYHEALEEIKKHFFEFGIEDCPKTIKIEMIDLSIFIEDYYILLDLIDNQDDYMSYQDLKAEYEKEITKLNKALDKACEMMSNWQDNLENYMRLELNKRLIGEYECGRGKEQIKEWLINE